MTIITIELLREWAASWLDGTDRSEDSAARVAWAAESAERKRQLRIIKKFLEDI